MWGLRGGIATHRTLSLIGDLGRDRFRFLSQNYTLRIIFRHCNRLGCCNRFLFSYSGCDDATAKTTDIALA